MGRVVPKWTFGKPTAKQPLTQLIHVALMDPSDAKTKRTVVKVASVIGPAAI